MFRIAHMGHVNAPMILGTLGVIEVGLNALAIPHLGTLGVIEVGLNALAIPHGKGGVQAAVEWLGKEVGV